MRRTRSSISEACTAVFLAAAIFSLSACSQAKHVEQDGDQVHNTVRIGFSMDSFVVERWQRDRDAFLDEARTNGVEVILRTANENLEVQRRHLLELAQSGIDVLVVVPNDAEGLSDIVESIRNRGIPVLAYDRLVRNTAIDGYVSFDNQGIGSMMAEAVLRELESPEAVNETVLVINGALSGIAPIS